MKSQQRTARRLFRKSRKRLVRYSLLTANIAILVAVVGLIVRNPETGQSVRRNALGITENSVAANPLDELSSADIAVHIARMAALEESTAVANLADTVNAQIAVTPSDDQVVAKPQIVATELKSRNDMTTYISKEGDTISSLAAQFGVTSDTIRYSNGLSANGDGLAVDTKLVISPVNGIVYEVQQGDTADTIASKFQANKEQIIAFNDAEVRGLKVGEKIVVPDGVQAVAVRTIASPASYIGGFSFGNGPVYGGNGYDYGYCTWWASVRRAQIGRPIPSNLGNAITWKSLAAQAGLGTGNTPAAGAVIWSPASSGYGHVGFVESINPDGSVNVTDMNVRGWNVVSNRTLSPAEAAGFGYIY